MKPEGQRHTSDEPESGPGIHSGDKNEDSQAIELTDEENLVLNLLKEKSPVDLNELKGQTGLSNKKWDIAIKGLRKHELVKVEKNDDGLIVSLL